MYDAPGIGLAAIQVAEPIRMITIDLAKQDEKPNPHVFINPEVVAKGEGTSVYEEGCLSIPDYFADVERPDSITVRYVDLHGKQQEMHAEGMMATCLQHELDHLDGVLFVDHISKLKRDMVVEIPQIAKTARHNLAYAELKPCALSLWARRILPFQR